MPADLKRAKFIKTERLSRGWTQDQLAQVAGVDTRTIQRLEKDGSASLETLMAVAQEFKMSVEQLTPPAPVDDQAAPQRRIHLLPRLLAGNELTYLTSNVDHLQFEHDDDRDPRSVSAMKDVLKAFTGDVVRLHDSDPAERPKIEEELSREFAGLEGLGYYIFGIRRVIPKVEGDKQSLVSLATFYMSHRRSLRVVRDGGLMVVPALLTEILR
jgi:transcriptional regulator with XRE-family HTH domain